MSETAQYAVADYWPSTMNYSELCICLRALYAALIEAGCRDPRPLEFGIGRAIDGRCEVTLLANDGEGPRWGPWADAMAEKKWWNKGVN